MAAKGSAARSASGAAMSKYDVEVEARLKALEAKVAQEGIILTEEQVQALEKKEALRQTHGEIESEHPGFLGSQDTYYVGNIKGVGRIYQQTFVDTYIPVPNQIAYFRIWKLSLIRVFETSFKISQS